MNRTNRVFMFFSGVFVALAIFSGGLAASPNAINAYLDAAKSASPPPKSVSPPKSQGKTSVPNKTRPVTPGQMKSGFAAKSMSERLVKKSSQPAQESLPSSEDVSSHAAVVQPPSRISQVTEDKLKQSRSNVRASREISR